MEYQNADTNIDFFKTADADKKGALKIFMGYAPGVGKTYTMLSEAQRRKQRGQDVVIGYVEPYGRDETIKQMTGLEIIPRRQIYSCNETIEEMDLDAIIKRKPFVVLVDELAHTNTPGLKNAKRYEDVLEILDAGINVISTMNIEHLESLNDVVFEITGIKVKDTIPDYVVDNADEVVMVDITPDALQNRLKRGNIHPPEAIDQALRKFFRKGNLSALRELALRQTAEEVDEELVEYMKEHGITSSWQTAERVLVCVSSSMNARKLIRRGARISRRLKCEWIVASVDCTHFFAPRISEKDRKNLQLHFKLAHDLGAETVTLSGYSISAELARFATEKHVTQIIIGCSNRTKLETILRGSTVNKLLKQTKNIEVHIIPTD